MNRRGLLVAAIAVSVLSAQLAPAQVPLPGFVVPVVVKAKGASGTDWRTDLFVTNLGSAGVQVSAHFFKQNQTNTFNGTFAKSGVTLAAGQTLLVTDLVASWFPSAGSNTKGWLLLVDTTPVADCEDPPDGAKLTVSVRIYNAADPSATYGQIAAVELLYVNPSTYPSVITGIRHQSKSAVPGMRTNVGVANLSNVQITVAVKVYRADGSLAGEAQKGVQALSLQQWDLEGTLAIPLLDAGGGRVEVSLVSGSPLDYCAIQEDPPACADPCDPEGCPNKYQLPTIPAFIAYASNVDNATGDGEHLTSVTDFIAYYAEVAEYLEDNCPEEDSGAVLARRYARRWGLAPSKEAPTFRKVRSSGANPAP